MKKASVFVGVLAASLMATGCQLFWPFLNPNNNPPKKTGAAALYRFKSGDELKQYLADQLKARQTSYQRGGWEGMWMFSVMPAAAPDAMNGLSGGAAEDTSSTDHSTTNLQEEGVDESDVMKNDANYVYLLKDQKLRIAHARPADDMEELGQLDIEGWPDSLYLRENSLVALSQKGGWYGPTLVDDVTSIGVAKEVSAPRNGWQNEAVVTLIDVADRTAPAVTKTYRFEGSLVSSRMIDGRLYLVLTITPDLPEPEEIPATPLDDLLPEYQAVEGNGTASAPSLIAPWQNFYRPADPDGYGFITVLTLDTTDPNADVESVVVTSDAGVVYASTEALYLTDTDWGYSDDSPEQTVVHKFDFTENGAEYAASGVVDGRPLNQFSLGEHEGYLRIATTIGRIWRTSTGPTNNVFVLGVGAKGLDVVGEVRGIAPGEEIYSARFLGKRGFLVTFEKVDPFFTLDLSDPTNPKVIGKLKIPGYSEYLHPMGENHILAIGKDAEDVGDFSWYQGVQLSIFDVTDFANPIQLHKLIIGGRGTESGALHDHRAFNYFEPKDLLAIPIVLYEGGTGGPTHGTHTFTGLFVFKVTVGDGFEELGRIATVDVQSGSQYWCCGSSWTRSVFIGDNVYAVTDEKIRSADIADVGSVLDTLIFDD